MSEMLISGNQPLLAVQPSKVSAKAYALTNDLFKNRWWQQLLPQKAKFAVAHQCVSCATLVLEYGTLLTTKQVAER
jgi:hypothetical protein